MELNREAIRAMIYYDWKFGLSQEESHERLRAALQDDAPSRATVFRWFSEFKHGRASFEDECREGRPSSAVTPENIELIRKLVEEDRHITIQQMEGALGIGSAAVQSILHEKLHLRKLACRWVPHQLTPDQMQARVQWCKEMLKRFDEGRSKRLYDVVTGDESWIYQYDPLTKVQSAEWVFPSDDPPVQVRRSRSVGKQMVASFFSLTGHVKTILLQNQATVTAAWYVEKCLPQVFQSIQERRPRTGIHGTLLHYDNAPAHTAHRTVEFLEQHGVHHLAHPPYSPDLAPADYFLFPRIKYHLRGHRFNSPIEAANAFQQAVEGVSDSDWKECFAEWFHRMKLCVQTCGQYFEKL